MENENNKTKKVNLLMIIIILLLLIILGLVGFMFWKSSRVDSAPVAQTQIASGLEIEKNQSGELVAKEVKEEVKKPGVCIPGWGTIRVKAGVTETDFTFYNPEKNTDWYYLTFEIRLPDDSELGYETIYKSGLIEPGNYVNNITLLRPLDVGEYNAIIFCQPYLISDQSAVNNAEMQAVIIAD